MEFALPSKAMDPSEVKTLDDHGKAYAHPDWLGRAEFLCLVGFVR